jgi:hypothetical protein
VLPHESEWSRPSNKLVVAVTSGGSDNTEAGSSFVSAGIVEKPCVAGLNTLDAGRDVGKCIWSQVLGRMPASSISPLSGGNGGRAVRI